MTCLWKFDWSSYTKWATLVERGQLLWNWMARLEMIILFKIRARQKSLQIKSIQPVNKINLSSLRLITNCVIVLVWCFFPVCISLTMPFRKMITLWWTCVASGRLFQHNKFLFLQNMSGNCFICGYQYKFSDYL